MANELQIPRTGGGCTKVLGGRGGGQGGGASLASAEVFDPADPAAGWAAVAPMPEPRCEAACFVRFKERELAGEGACRPPGLPGGRHALQGAVGQT